MSTSTWNRAVRALEYMVAAVVVAAIMFGVMYVIGYIGGYE